MHVKVGVQVRKLVPQMALAMLVMERIYSELQYPCWITSGDEGFDGDGVHKAGSKHYTGEALDFRIRDPQGSWKMTPGEVAVSITWAKHHLPDFDVVRSPLNIHVEWDPKPQEPIVT